MMIATKSVHQAVGFASLIILSVFTLVFSKRENNIFSAVTHMKPLMKIEKRLIDIAKNYLKEQKRKLAELAPFVKSVKEAMKLSEGDPERYLGNPINCYLIIKRFTSGWKDLPSRLKVDESSLKDINDVLRVNAMYMPSEEVDVSGATAAIIRIMDNYDITARDIAEGKIARLKPSTYQLTASDCMDIADAAHTDRRYVRMKEWLLEAERLINDPTVPHRHGNTTCLSVNEYLSWSCYLENDLKNALKYTNLVLRDDPEHKGALENKVIYSYYVESNIPCTQRETSYMKEAVDIMNIKQQSMFIQMCKKKNKKLIGYKNVWNLRCFYRQDSPRLYLKPIKVSQVHDNPEVYILHDVLSEQQMDTLKEIALPRLRVAEVVDPHNNSRISAHYRVSKSMFLFPNLPADREISEKLRPVFEAMSGLSMELGEELQMNNYGLGGQYETHHDYGEPGTLIANDPSGNRLATLLLYLSNVESGGETVFTEIGLSIPPMKGSAIFWYNLHRNGTGFFNTKHASCPIISGSKWVANKWVRERGNEFRRCCSLNQFE